MIWKCDNGLLARQIVAWLIIGLLYVALFSVITWLLAGTGKFGSSLLYCIIGMAAIMTVLIQYFLSDKLVLLSTRSKIVSEDEEPRLYAMVEKLAREADIPMPRVAIMPSAVPNAFATGRSPKHAVVAVTQAIRGVLTDEELETVLAHELAHVKNRDMLTMTIGSFLVSIASMIVNNALLLTYLHNSRNSDGRGELAASLAMFVAVAVYIVGTLVTLAISRYREFAADRGSAYITRNPDALIRALKKISGSMDTVPPDKKREISTNNAFYIIPAISGESIMELISTHPSLEKRIANLEMVKQEMSGY